MFKNKKLIFVSIIVVLLITVFAINSTKVNVIKQHSIVVGFESVEELSEKADLTLMVKPVGQRENVINGTGYNKTGYTLTQVKVKEVLQSNKDDVKKGDVIEIIEPYWIDNTNIIGAKNKIIDDGYTELQNGNLYIMIIRYSDYFKAYATYGVAQSKYNVDGKDKEEKFEKDKDKHLEKLHEQIMKKYNKEIEKNISLNN